MNQTQFFSWLLLPNVVSTFVSPTVLLLLCSTKCKLLLLFIYPIMSCFKKLPCTIFVKHSEGHPLGNPIYLLFLYAAYCATSLSCRGMLNDPSP